MEPLKFTVEVYRISANKLNREKMINALAYIAESAERNKTYGFVSDYSLDNLKHEFKNGEHHYKIIINVIKDKYKDSFVVARQWSEVRENMVKAAKTQRWKIDQEKRPADVSDIPANAIIKSKSIFHLPPLDNKVKEQYFGRLYNLDAQIRITYDSINQAIRTKYKERNHTLLRGKAGCGKTEILLAFQEWLGEEYIWSVDATTMTKAGLEKELLKRSLNGTLPPIVKFEEIEKVQEPKNINCLLQVMDTRARIQRLNAAPGGGGDQYAECRILVLATCNDSNHLRKFADGAIWSRFSLRPVCKRPDRDTMKRILMRVCKEVMDEGGYTGTEEHVNIICEFMYGALKSIPEYRKDYNDPRLGKALLSGADRLLDEGPEGFLRDFEVTCMDDDEYGEAIATKEE